MSPEGGGQSHQRFFQGGGRLHYNDSEEKLVL